MSGFVERFGPWAVVTGASSGIGEAFARRLAARGINLVLVARREERLNALAAGLGKPHGIETRVVVADLATDDILPAVERATRDLEVGLLVNNAGVLRAGKFLDHDLGDELNQLHLNTRAALVLAHHFGRRMRDRRRGGMVFLASTVAFAGVPGMSAYAASKAHALTFAEGLARELADDGVAVLALCPGPTRSEIWPAGATPALPMSPEDVAEAALRKLGRRTTVVAGLLNRLITFSTRFGPRWLNSRIFGKVVGGMFKNVGPGSAAPEPTEPRTPATTGSPTGS
jgi:short-subunit dehydrogenase